MDLELPVEHFMRDYYQQARSVASFSQIVIEQCQTRCDPSTRPREVRGLEDGFQIAEDGQSYWVAAKLAVSGPYFA